MAYPKYDLQVELLCYCLMNNHFHLLVYAGEQPEMLTTFMRSVMTAYSMYFNKRHKRQGTLFQGVYKASRITNDTYLQHISRYIHLNPRTFRTYKFSSLRYYVDPIDSPVWLKPDRIVEMFRGSSYIKFVEDYVVQHKMLEELYSELADK